ncbi:MAG: type II secretion system protein [Verrucomicrobiota bacterium]|jgi:prepilin-type N-terminal cleavage/methylation domain-containing protein
MFTNDANGPDCWKCSLNVEWHDCSFCPEIQMRRAILRRNGSSPKPEPAPPVMPNPLRRQNLFKPMKTTKLSTSRRSRKPAGFTLVELLTVIAIIGILAAMLLPVLATVTKHAKMMKARTEIRALVTAIEGYDQAYGRFPVSRTAQAAAATTGQANGNYDFTYGGIFNGAFPGGAKVGAVGTVVQSTGTILTNNEVIAILMDITNFAATGLPTVNNGHQSNPQMTKFLNAMMSGWDPSVPNSGPPPGGVDNTLTYRDPWGNPYIISMDLNYDDQCQDSFYCRKAISSTGNGGTGYYGLSNPNPRAQPDNYLFHGKVMVWSAGPDGKVDMSGATGANAVTGFNKDNILSWVQ